MTTTTTSPTAFPASTAPRRTNFLNVLRSEWSKLSTLRSTYLMLALGFVLSVATTALVATALGATNDEWSADLSPITVSMIGMIWALIVYAVFGVMVVSREYASGTIRLTLIATPSRSRVFFAKLLIVTAITLAAGLVTTTAMFFTGQAVLDAYGMPSASLANGDAQRMVFGLGAVMPFFPVLGLAFGMLLRSTAGGITTVLGVLWLPQIVGELAPM